MYIEKEAAPIVFAFFSDLLYLSKLTVCKINFQMTLMMMTICGNYPKCPSREPSQSTALLAARWTNTLPWLVIYASVSLKMLGTVSVAAFDFFVCFLVLFFSRN